jgi:group I intron endonuclease
MISIYIYENLINGKVYIGQTNDLKNRDRQHKTGDKNIPFDYAIKKYGRANFSLNVITEVDTTEQADYTEIEWIARARDLLDKENVYNISDGGDSSTRGKNLSEITKNKISESHKNLEHHSGRYVLHHDVPQEIKDKISKSNKGKIAHNKDKPCSEDQKKKQSETMSGRKLSETHTKKMSENMKGNKINLGKCRLSDDQLQQMKILRLSGLSYNKISKIVGCNIKSVIKWVKLT